MISSRSSWPRGYHAPRRHPMFICVSPILALAKHFHHFHSIPVRGSNISAQSSTLSLSALSSDPFICKVSCSPSEHNAGDWLLVVERCCIFFEVSAFSRHSQSFSPPGFIRHLLLLTFLSGVSPWESATRIFLLVTSFFFRLNFHIFSRVCHAR